jgi:LysR substrate binding domain
LQLQDIAAEAWFLPSPHIRIRRWLDGLITEPGLPPPNVRVGCDTVNLRHYRFLRRTGMLAVCSAWMLPSIRRFGLELLPVSEPALEREIASMRRAGGHVSPLCARLEELLRIGARSRRAA